jgi:deoxycytidine triphosphate deaminase
MSSLDFTTDQDEAARRFDRFRYSDPFPSIPAALLNSADIRDYVSATGMICPFRDDSSNLKPASYEVALLGRYVYWDENGNRRDEVIEAGDDFILKANSIAFVTLEPMFRLPAYIALRFNLKITNVYRGLLLGTGPLVDPGFEGRLSIPLHNLTTNDYTLRGGDGLIWMEFTKLSPDPGTRRRRRDARTRRGEVVPLPQRKRGNLDVSDYLHKADPHRPIRSSIPGAVEEASSAAVEAADSARASELNVQRVRQSVEIATLIALVFGILAAVGVVFQIFSLVNDVNQRLDQIESQLVQPASSDTEDLRSRVTELEAEVRRLTREVSRP